LTSVVLVSPIGNAIPVPPGPLVIDGNADLQSKAASYDWLGDGTAANPYIVANLTIEEGGLAIRNTDAYLLVKNCTLGNATIGIEVTGASNLTLDDNHVVATNGVNITDSHNITVSNNSIASQGDYGVVLFGHVNATTIYNNTLTSRNEGIYLYPGSNNNTVNHNTINGNLGKGIFLSQSNNNAVFDNTIIYPNDDNYRLNADAIYLRASEENIIRNNTINHSHGGIYLRASSNNTVAYNTVHNALEDGIFLFRSIDDVQASNDNIIINNTITGTLAGIELSQASKNTVANNTVTDSLVHGIQIQGDDNAIANNTISGAIVGIYLGGGWYNYQTSAGSSDGNAISNNTVIDAISGINVIYSTRSVITNNTIIAGTTDDGYVEGICLDSTNAYLDGNRLTNCSVVMYFGDVGHFINAQAYIDGMTITSTNTVNGDPIYFRKNVNMNNESVSAGVGQVILLNVTYLNVNGLDLNYGGVIARSSAHITMTENIISNATEAILLDTSNNCIVYDNLIVEPSDIGIVVDRSNDNTIEENIIFSAGYFGIVVGNGYNVSLQSPILESGHNVVSSNIIIASEEAGVYMNRYSGNNTVTDNAINGTGFGIRSGGNNDTIANNSIADIEGTGIYLERYAYNSRVVNNTVSGATEGIVVNGSANNVITENRITGSSSYGIRSISNDGSNVIYANVLIGNNGATATYDAAHPQAYDDSDNLWMNGIMGNYWSDWQTPDADHDGIVDVPYLLAGNAGVRDDLPMVLFYVYITSHDSPAYTNLSSILVSGTAYGLDSQNMVVTWTNEATEESGTCTGNASWSANIALVEGSNHIIVTMTDSSGNHTSDDMTVICDVVAPIVTAHTPTGDAVSVNAPITVTFSEAMNTSSVSIVIDGVTGTLSWSGNVATFTPSSPLAHGSNYSVAVSGRDLAGNAVSYEWEFVTSNVGSISGTVQDANNHPIVGATVTLSNGMTTTTDANGRYVFDNVVPGTYNLTVTKDGYKTTTQSVTARAGLNTDAGVLSVQATTSNSSSNDMLIIGAAFVVIVALLAAAFLLMRRKKT
jgi:parallel beta-helix repeat protein